MWLPERCRSVSVQSDTNLKLFLLDPGEHAHLCPSIFSPGDCAAIDGET